LAAFAVAVKGVDFAGTPAAPAADDQEIGWIWSSHLITSLPDLRSDIDPLGWALRACCCKSLRVVLM
jgi:hypothetical protein